MTAKDIKEQETEDAIRREVEARVAEAVKKAENRKDRRDRSSR